jgi:hypothetical protein
MSRDARKDCRHDHRDCDFIHLRDLVDGRVRRTACNAPASGDAAGSGARDVESSRDAAGFRGINVELSRDATDSSAVDVESSRDAAGSGARDVESSRDR